MHTVDGKFHRFLLIFFSFRGHIFLYYTVTRTLRFVLWCTTLRYTMKKDDTALLCRHNILVVIILCVRRNFIRDHRDKIFLAIYSRNSPNFFPRLFLLLLLFPAAPDKLVPSFFDFFYPHHRFEETQSFLHFHIYKNIADMRAGITFLYRITWFENSYPPLAEEYRRCMTRRPVDEPAVHCSIEFF